MFVQELFLSVPWIQETEGQAMTRKLLVFECATIPGSRQTSLRARKDLEKQIFDVGVDEALAKAKSLLKADKRRLRSCSMDTDGNVRVVIWKGDPPKPSLPEGWLFKRPPTRD